MAELQASGRGSNGPHVGRAIAQARTDALARVWPMAKQTDKRS
jgi:hypothetical protein